MQQSFKKIQQFISSPDCLFNLQPIDYPTLEQQSMIQSYFLLRKILTKPHAQIIRQLNTQSQKQIQQISLGFLYMFMLDKQNIEKLGQYIVVLRIQIWNSIAKFFQELFSQNGDVVKSIYRRNCVPLFNLLALYGICLPFTVGLLAGFVHTYDSSNQAKALIKQIIQMFTSKLQENFDWGPDVVSVICHYLLPKVIKITPYICQKQSLKLISLILNKYGSICFELRQQLFYILQSSPNYPKIPQLLQLYQALKEDEKKNSNSTLIDLRKLEQVIFSYLPRRVQIVLQFMFDRDVKDNSLVYQLTWLEKNWINKRINYGDILAQLARWASISSPYLQQKIVILQWACKKCLSMSLDLAQKIKKAIFYPWFLNCSPTFDSTLNSLILLRHFLGSDSHVSIQLLKYLFKIKLEHERRIHLIFTQAIKYNHFRAQFVTENRLILASIQQQFLELLRQPKIAGEDLRFDPDSPNKLDEENLNYQQYAHRKEVNQVPVVEVSQMIPETQQRFQIPLQQEYIDEFTTLQNLLDNPNFQNFIQFFKQFCQLSTKTPKNKQLLQTILQQTSKLLYCLFNSQFQNPQQTCPKQNITLYIIKILLKDWHQVTHRIMLIKQLIKKMFQLFPMTEITFYFHFFVSFQPTEVNCRDFKNWLVCREKETVCRAVEASVGREKGSFRKRFQRFFVGK